MLTRSHEASDRVKSRVLVVDDELALVRAYERTLTKAGHEVVVAKDGLQARELIERGDLDVVLSDVWMPGVDGLELLRVSRERDRSVPVIIMTGAPTAEGAAAAAANGALMYLAKPVELRSLQQVVGLRVAPEPEGEGDRRRHRVRRSAAARR